MNKNSKIFVAGHNGLVGSALVKRLKELGYDNIITRNRRDLDLTSEMETKLFFALEMPEYVFDCAAMVGGIAANNTQGADFMLNNLKIQNNIIESCHKFNVKKLLFLGSSCIYPKNSPQPIKEEYLLTSELEKTNEPYAIAKIAGLKLCEYFKKQYGDNFISVMPTNLYGSSQDNYNKETSHVLPALIRKIHDAKMNNDSSVILWGDGTPLREFLHVNDLANALIFLMNNYDEIETINVGTGTDITIKDLANKIKSIIKYDGEIIWDSSKPNGTMRKLLNCDKIHKLGWNHTINIDEGLKLTYEEFIKNTPRKL